MRHQPPPTTERSSAISVGALLGHCGRYCVRPAPQSVRIRSWHTALLIFGIAIIQIIPLFKQLLVIVGPRLAQRSKLILIAIYTVSCQLTKDKKGRKETAN